MDDSQHKHKKTLKDVSHLFLSSMEKPNVQEHVEPSSINLDSQHFRPTVKVVSLFPVGCDSISLLLHVFFAKLLFYSQYKIYIISTNPHRDSWTYLEREFNMPSFVDIDFSKDIRSFQLHKNAALLVGSHDSFVDFFSFKKAALPLNYEFDSEEQPLLFLVDFFNVDPIMHKHVSSLVDSFLMFTSARVEDIRSTYKMIKAQREHVAHATYKIVLNEQVDARMKTLLDHEFNKITSEFLRIAVEFIGSCECGVLSGGNNRHWQRKETEQPFTISTDFLNHIQKNSWTEELLSLYQTTISNIRL